ncbi:MAG: sulfatase, partial [Planctomycetota bacterium]|nr:sulfatase [Planctomycetota bacterium]
MSAMNLSAAIPALLALVLVGCGGQVTNREPTEAPVRPEQPDIVLIVIDTLRADRLSCYGNERQTSPNIDALALRGARFENAFAPAPWTLPSTASMLTGRLPQVHGAGLSGMNRDMNTATPLGPSADIPTLAQHLDENGYATRAFVTNPYLTFGLERGFQTFEHKDTEGADVANFADMALAEADLERPLFLLLHFMDCHDPLLTPDQDARALSDAGLLPQIWSRTFETLPRSVVGREERLLAYDASIHYVDRQVGRILDSLQRSGRADNTIVLVTSDHGEELFEHAAIESEPSFGLPSHRPAGLGHGHSLFDEVLRVPFVIAGPNIPAGQTIATDITLMD